MNTKQYRLGDIADIFSGATPKTSVKTYYDGGDIPWITPKDLSGYRHKYISDGQRRITKEGYESCATVMLPEGAVLFSSRAPIGYVAIAGKSLCTNQGFKSFVCKDSVLYNQYLYYYLIKNKDRFEALGNGSTFKEISRKTISEYRIELPSLEDQISSVRELIDLDQKYDENCRTIEQLESLLECLYCKYFEDGKITSFELKDLVEVITGGTPSTKVDSYWTNGIYDWYTPSDFTANRKMITYGAMKKISVSGLANSSAKLIPESSVLMTSRATIGKAVINMNEAATNQGMMALVPRNERMSAVQLYFWVKRNKERINSIGNGSTFKEVYKRDLEKLRVELDFKRKPEFDARTKKLFELYKSLEKENHTIRELRNCILDSVFV